MSLKPCRECKSLISREAKVCQKCGISKPIKASTNWIALIAFLIIVFVIITPKNEKKSTEEISIDNTKSNQAQKLNEAKAQLEIAMKDPRKLRYMECLGVNPRQEKPEGWAKPTKQECKKLEKVLDAEAKSKDK